MLKKERNRTQSMTVNVKEADRTNNNDFFFFVVNQSKAKAM